MPPRWLAPGIIFRPDKKSVTGVRPPAWAPRGSPATICHPNPQGSTRMVMVAERNGAGMRRRARRDQNDREEKAETMRRKLVSYYSPNRRLKSLVGMRAR